MSIWAFYEKEGLLLYSPNAFEHSSLCEKNLANGTRRIIFAISRNSEQKPWPCIHLLSKHLGTYPWSKKRFEDLIEPIFGLLIADSHAKRNYLLRRTQSGEYSNPKRLLIGIDFLDQVEGEVKGDPLAKPFKVLFHQRGNYEQKVGQFIHAVVEWVTMHLVFLFI